MRRRMNVVRKGRSCPDMVSKVSLEKVEVFSRVSKDLQRGSKVLV